MELLASIIEALKDTNPGWAMLIGSLGSLYFTAKIYKEKSDSNRSGIGIRNIDKNGIATLVNDSHMDYSVRAERYVLEKGENEKDANDFLLDFFGSTNKKEFIENKRGNALGEEILAEQILGSGETAGVHLYDYDISNSCVIFVLLKLFYGKESRSYLYYFSNSEKIEKSDIFSEFLKNKLHPYNDWIKVYSF